MDYFDKEEKEIIESYENEEWVSSDKTLKKEIEKAAKNSTLKNKRINIRLTKKDFKDIQFKQWKRVSPIRRLSQASSTNTI